MTKTNKNQLNLNKDKLISLTVKEQLKQFLLSNEGCISIEEAIKEVEEKWPRSK